MQQSVVTWRGTTNQPLSFRLTLFGSLFLPEARSQKWGDFSHSPDCCGSSTVLKRAEGFLRRLWMLWNFVMVLHLF